MNIRPIFSKFVVTFLLSVPAICAQGLEPEQPATVASSTSLPTNTNDTPTSQIHPIHNSPLGDRRIGLDLNLVGLATWNVFVAKFASGGISYFDYSRKMEWMIPLLYEKSTDFLTAQKQLRPYYKAASVDIRARKYFGETLNGFYFGAFARATYQEGYTKLDLFEFKPVGHMSSGIKYGFGAETGYRIFSRKGMYWGIGVGIGKYFFGDKQKYTLHLGSPWSAKENHIIYIEGLKFGYAF